MTVGLIAGTVRPSFGVGSKEFKMRLRLHLLDNRKLGWYPVCEFRILRTKPIFCHGDHALTVVVGGGARTPTMLLALATALISDGKPRIRVDHISSDPGSDSGKKISSTV